jgi:prepilin-type N-terminal cleavage/methylation domain-containing protein
MRTQWIFKQKGVTLIELLVALVICGVAIGAIYRLFIVQTRAYTVQDQVVEVQQNVRSTMEILLRDLRMTGYDDDSITSTVSITNPIPAFTNNSITVSYEYLNQINTVSYWVSAPPFPTLFRQATVGGLPAQPLLDNVDNLTFKYGVDTNSVDGAVDKWVNAADVGTDKIIAVQVTLTGRPDQTNPDVQMRVSPRKLTSFVSFRNRIMK